jgi:hypothetical protein
VSEPTRERVRATIGLVGGYWRPLAAVARLLEELGELAELDRDDPRYASELADLWIITTALSDQFLGAVAEPGSHLSRRPPPDLLGSLVAAAGPIARIVNYYDGPKAPRDFDDWISLSDAVAGFHRVLSDAAQAHDVDLAKAVNTKLDSIPALDSERFASGAHDPSTAASVERFRALHGAIVRAGGAGPPPRASSDFPARWGPLWGSPECSPGDFTSNLDQIVADLASFTKASPWERIEGYVVCGPPLSSPRSFEDWFARLLGELVSRDPAAGPRADSAAESHASIGREGPERHFSFNGLGLIASGFCSLYDVSNPQPSAGTLIVLFPARAP